mgnify:CR=1 FL=1|jgi:hypothetical protein
MTARSRESGGGFNPEQQPKSEEIPLPLELDPVRETELEIIMFNTMVDAYEEKHDLPLLLSIEGGAEAKASPERQAAKADLAPIVALLRQLSAKTEVLSNESDSMRQRYKKLSQAVGMINSGRVDHTR